MPTTGDDQGVHGMEEGQAGQSPEPGQTSSMHSHGLYADGAEVPSAKAQSR